MATGLATRCPACGTVFRVVPDQLRVSEGWVRCGRCSDVFNAAEVLVDLETGAPRRVSFEAPLPPAPVERAAAPEPDYAEDFDFRAARDQEPEPGTTQADPRSTVPVIDTTESRFAADAAEAFDGPDSEDAPQGRAADRPSFVRRAERAQRWRHPRVRLVLMLLAVLAVGGLAAQTVYEYRDLVAARYPATRSALEHGCALMSCTVGAAHSIDGLAVESSGLVRVEKSSIYRLSVALRNRAGIDVALPAVDLVLTDSQGKLLARRVLRATELGAAAATLTAGRELTLQATLQMNTEPVAGYTIELFYP